MKKILTVFLSLAAAAMLFYVIFSLSMPVVGRLDEKNSYGTICRKSDGVFTFDFDGYAYEKLPDGFCVEKTALDEEPLMNVRVKSLFFTTVKSSPLFGLKGDESFRFLFLGGENGHESEGIYVKKAEFGPFFSDDEIALIVHRKDGVESVVPAGSEIFSMVTEEACAVKDGSLNHLGKPESGTYTIFFKGTQIRYEFEVS